jgi:NADPH:quinone reductase-like Zn-dependent oxidoreductase
MRAAGVNRPDIIQRLGMYPPPPGAPETMGLEVAGEVAVAAGALEGGRPGPVPAGAAGYADYAVVETRATSCRSPPA